MGEEEIREMPEPTDWSELMNSRFLHAADLKGQYLTRKITKVVMEMMPDEKHPGQEKVVGSLVLEGERKIFGLNTTNLYCVKAMFGPKCVEWKGRRITLYPTKTKMPDPVTKKRVDVDCIRVAGSPDIEADVAFDLVLPRKKPVPMTMKKMLPKGAQGGGGGGGQAGAAKPAPARQQVEEPPPPGDPFA